MNRIAVSAVLLLAAVGCKSTSTDRQFDVRFADAEEKLRVLYPPAPTGRTDKIPLGMKGPIIAIRRDEWTTDGEILIVVQEGAKAATRTTRVTLKDLKDSRSEVSVQTSTINKAVIFPPRDEAYEKTQMEEIAKALK